MFIYILSLVGSIFFILFFYFIIFFRTISDPFQKFPTSLPRNQDLPKSRSTINNPPNPAFAKVGTAPGITGGVEEVRRACLEGCLGKACGGF